LIATVSTELANDTRDCTAYPVRLSEISVAQGVDGRYIRWMVEFDYSAPAELFSPAGRTGLRYRRFPRAAEAIRYAVEKLPLNIFSASSLQVNEEHYNASQIRALYDSASYPLARSG
jgi:hypothetical protein